MPSLSWSISEVVHHCAAGLFCFRTGCPGRVASVDRRIKRRNIDSTKRKKTAEKQPATPLRRNAEVYVHPRARARTVATPMIRNAALSVVTRTVTRVMQPPRMPSPLEEACGYDSSSATIPSSECPSPRSTTPVVSPEPTMECASDAVAHQPEAFKRIISDYSRFASSLFADTSAFGCGPRTQAQAKPPPSHLVMVDATVAVECAPHDGLVGDGVDWDFEFDGQEWQVVWRPVSCFDAYTSPMEECDRTMLMDSTFKWVR